MVHELGASTVFPLFAAYRANVVGWSADEGGQGVAGNTRHQMSLHSLLNLTCDIEQSVETPDGKGSVTQQWGPVLSGIRCRIRPLKAEEASQYDKGTFRNTARGYFEDAITETQGQTSLRDLIGRDTVAPFRVKSDSRLFEIGGVLDYDEQNRVCVLELHRKQGSWRT